MDRETLITVEHLSRDYGDHRAVDDVSFTVGRGEVLGFLGPNGAGKTTTMHIICGVLAPGAGRVSVAGHDIVEQARAAKRHLGYLPEQPPLYFDLSVDQYLDYCARLRRLPAAARAEALTRTKQRCGLADVGRRLIGNLSKGYRQRVGIAQAIIHSPAVVVLDEPTVGLDPNQIVEIRALIAALGEDHSVILSTHILPEVQAVCGRVLIINDGRLILDESIDAVGAGAEQVLAVAFRHPPQASALQQVAGVRGVTPLGGDRFRVTTDPAVDAAVAIGEAAARDGWGLYELTPVAGTLEETFLRLTRGDIETDSAEAA